MSVSPYNALPWKPLHPEDHDDRRKTAKVSGTVLRRALYTGLKTADQIVLSVVTDDDVVLRLVEEIPSHPDVMLAVQYDQVSIRYLKCDDGGLALQEFTIDWQPAIRSARKIAAELPEHSS